MGAWAPEATQNSDTPQAGFANRGHLPHLQETQEAEEQIKQDPRTQSARQVRVLRGLSGQDNQAVGRQRGTWAGAAGRPGFPSWLCCIIAV